MGNPYSLMGARVVVIWSTWARAASASYKLSTTEMEEGASGSVERTSGKDVALPSTRVERGVILGSTFPSASSKWNDVWCHVASEVANSGSTSRRGMYEGRHIRGSTGFFLYWNCT